MTIKEYTEQAVRQYLRTVLFVDDHIFSSGSSTANEHAGKEVAKLPPMPDSENKDDVAGNRENAMPVQLEGSEATQEVNPQDIVEGFAKEKIVCGLYQPESTDFSNESTRNQLIDLCKHADIFILDWKLGSHVQTVEQSPIPDILSTLIESDLLYNDPKPIRLCAIYTSLSPDTIHPFLKQILINKFGPQGITIDGESNRLHLGGLTIQIYGKAEEQDNYVSAVELANRIIKDFTIEYEGIMSATALYGIAAVRDNAKRILDKFPPSLDYALMLHAGLTVEAPTVPEDMQDLLADEIHSILSGKKISDDEVFLMLKEKASVINAAQLDGIFTADELKNDMTAEKLKQFFVSLFENRKMPNSKPFTECQSGHKHRKISHDLLQKLQNLVIKLAGTTSYSAGALSRLFCLRTVYEPKRILKSGTIVQNLSNHSYYLCLMPACDCVRLSKNITAFPFWELAIVNNRHDGRAHGLVIQDANGQSLSLCLKGKIRKQMNFWSFQPDNEVYFRQDETTHKFLLNDVSNSETMTTFEWIAELKPLHAQRMAEYVSQQFSRVGLAESEWLRLQVDR